MSKVHYFTACTLDGFIADENNSLDWLFEVPHDEEDRFWDDWFPSVGGLVMGATTYEWMVEHDQMLNNPPTTATGPPGSSPTATSPRSQVSRSPLSGVMSDPFTSRS